VCVWVWGCVWGCSLPYKYMYCIYDYLGTYTWIDLVQNTSTLPVQTVHIKQHNSRNGKHNKVSSFINIINSSKEPPGGDVFFYIFISINFLNCFLFYASTYCKICPPPPPGRDGITVRYLLTGAMGEGGGG
jgi:hypothetical protein